MNLYKKIKDQLGVDMTTVQEVLENGDRLYVVDRSVTLLSSRNDRMVYEAVERMLDFASPRPTNLYCRAHIVEGKYLEVTIFTDPGFKQSNSFDAITLGQPVNVNGADMIVTSKDNEKKTITLARG